MKKSLQILMLGLGLASGVSACDDAPVVPATTAVSGQSASNQIVDKDGDGWADNDWNDTGSSTFVDPGTSISANSGLADSGQTPAVSAGTGWSDVGQSVAQSGSSSFDSGAGSSGSSSSSNGSSDGSSNDDWN